MNVPEISLFSFQEYEIMSFHDVFKILDAARDAKNKQLRKAGKGLRPCASDAISNKDINQLYERRLLGPHSARSITNSLFVMIT